MKYSLVVDLGNTSIKYAVFAGEKFVCQTKMIIHNFSIKEAKILINKMLNENKIVSSEFEDAILFSVAPSLNKSIQRIVASIFNLKLNIFSINDLKQLPQGVPPEIGADLLADIIGGICFYKHPLLIVDLGTVTKFIFIGKDAQLDGCSFMPGMDSSLKTMTHQTELLPELRIEKPKQRIGKNTLGCMKSGVYYSTVAALDHFKNVANEEYGSHETIITGGYAEVIKDEINDSKYDELLTLKGMNKIRLDIKEGK